MAIMWQKFVNNTDYQVRNAGRTIRLYTDGILHTEYNPGHKVTGSVWDLLLLGAFHIPKESLKRVLVLGVGGGAVIHQIQSFFPEAHITGVEINPVHLRVAKTFFDLNPKNLKLVKADAIEWVSSHQAETYDLIIEDLFGEIDGEPDRVQELNKAWIKKLDQLLSPQGVLVVNFIDRDSLVEGASRIYKTRNYASALRYTTKNCFNIVGIFSRNPVKSKDVLMRLRDEPLLDRRKKTCRLQYHVRKLF